MRRPRRIAIEIDLYDADSGAAADRVANLAGGAAE
jgi:hypothetical protein